MSSLFPRCDTITMEVNFVNHFSKSFRWVQIAKIECWFDVIQQQRVHIHRLHISMKSVFFLTKICMILGFVVTPTSSPLLLPPRGIRVFHHGKYSRKRRSKWQHTYAFRRCIDKKLERNSQHKAICLREGQHRSYSSRQNLILQNTDT